MLASPLVTEFIEQHPAALEARFQMGRVVKVVINGKPVE